jgi:DNA-binding NtrC family response regulator
MEDGRVTRIGESKERGVNVRFVLASNAPPPDYFLVHDILNRLRVIRIAPLKERVADVPSIFDAVLKAILEKHGINGQRVFEMIRADHYESMCLDGFSKDNVRGLMDLADRLATRMKSKSDASAAVKSVFGSRFKGNAVFQRYLGADGDASSHYAKHKKQIIAAYCECGNNISAAERHLKEMGINCSRRWLTVYLDRWGARGESAEP